METLIFSVDRQLRLTRYSGSDTEPGAAILHELGQPYHRVFPPLLHDDADALLQVMATARPLLLPAYRFCCFYQAVQADVRIEPEVGAGGEVTGAAVTIAPFPGCSFFSRLQKSQKLIDLGKTASILSHGVRNPLNAIKGAVVYLKNRYGEDGELLEFTGIMEAEIERLDSFISGFLSNSLFGFEQKKNDVNLLLRRLELFVSMQARSVGVDIRFARGSVPLLQMNVFQVEHAVLNLINNAIQALPAGGSICVSSRLEVRERRRFVVLEIADDGPGMPPALKGRFSAPCGDLTASEGRGFGLFITREVLQHHGGSVEIVGGEERGTTVRLLFPAEEIE